MSTQLEVSPRSPFVAVADHTTSKVAPRVSFRQPVTSDPFVDAAWWPRSRDLQAELPGLLELMWDAGREVVRVSYALGSWLPVPRQLRIGGRVVRLGGFVYTDAAMISLRDAWGSERVDVLVIAPDADPAVAAKVMMLVSRPGRNETAATTLARATEAIHPGIPSRRDAVGSSCTSPF